MNDIAIDGFASIISSVFLVCSLLFATNSMELKDQNSDY